MNRLRNAFYIFYLIYCLALFYLCFRLLQVPNAAGEDFYPYLSKEFDGYSGLRQFLESYFRPFQIFMVFALVLSLLMLASDYFGKMFLRAKVDKLQKDVNSLKAKLYDKDMAKPSPPAAPVAPKPLPEK